MIRFAILVFIGSGALCLAAGDAEKGKAVYQKTCQKCHGADGKGNAAMAKGLKIEFKSLASPEVQKKSDAELKKLSIGPHGKKVPVKGVTPEQLEDVISYVRTMK